MEDSNSEHTHPFNRPLLAEYLTAAFLEGSEFHGPSELQVTDGKRWKTEHLRAHSAVVVSVRGTGEGLLARLRNQAFSPARFSNPKSNHYTRSLPLISSKSTC